ncbi:TNT domain-containing protein [Streptomyces hilarionis]|uniref:TNT domain-containing protein n=1 Tax=Streptomyces hilarionis TaxID=2839954 RepID=UPI00211A659E|nr:TNT domain-containing protein [Streptomyces hilarionis]MCQ9136358.1 TNT domain-containing protein [Streptomyces hilarionis]
MKSSRWWAGVVAAVSLSASLVMGASASSSATAADHDGRTAAVRQVRPGTSAPAPVGPLAHPGDGHGPGRPRACEGLVPYPIPEAYRPYYFCGDWRLGPRWLPTRGPVGAILKGYDRLGGLTAVAFLNRWWNPAADSGQGDWRYPSDDGFAHDIQGGVIAAPLVLHANQNLLLDRFGNEAGRFLASAGTRYGLRALPPSSLDTTDPRYPYNYHLYRLAKDVTVCAGPQAPAFEQPGTGIQYVTSSSFCPSIPRTSVADLVGNGTLVRLKATYPSRS